MPGKLFCGGVCQTCIRRSGLIIGQRPEQHRIHHAEDRGVRSNTQRQREHRSCGEARSAQHRAQAVAQILQQSFREVHATRFAAFFLRVLDSAKFQPRAP